MASKRRSLLLALAFIMKYVPPKEKAKGQNSLVRVCHYLILFYILNIVITILNQLPHRLLKNGYSILLVGWMIGE